MSSVRRVVTHATRRVLLAGGAGFIGSYLAERLVAAGDELIVVDDLSTGFTCNLGAVECELVVGDVCDADVLAPFRERGVVDAVVNLASPASPPAYLARPLETLEVGSTGTRNLLDVALAAGARFVLASTSEIYGDPEVHPQSEAYRGNVSPTGPRSCYDESKRFAEAITAAYRRVHGLDVRIARIFNTYGPRLQVDDGRVVTNFVYQALEGRPLTIYGDGSQTRSFCYVDDLVDGLVALLDAPESDAIAEPINLGNPDEITILELAERVVARTGSASPIEHLELPVDDPRVRRPDIRRARELLGWDPQVDLDEGLDLTIDAFRRG
jgi:dTDP-glucose 4,6-dehydratase